MRFESKHCCFKLRSSKLNFKNVCKSLVKHNQMFESCHNISRENHPIFSKDVLLGPASEVENMKHVQDQMRDFGCREGASCGISKMA